MPRVTLKSILSKKNNTEALVLSLLNEMKAHISITDEKHNYLCGNTEILTATRTSCKTAGRNSWLG